MLTPGGYIILEVRQCQCCSCYVLCSQLHAEVYSCARAVQGGMLHLQLLTNSRDNCITNSVHGMGVDQREANQLLTSGNAWTCRTDNKRICSCLLPQTAGGEQAERVRGLLEEAKDGQGQPAFTNTQVHTDYYGVSRFVSGSRTGGS